MTLADASLWFRYRCQIIDNIKGNKSSHRKDDMACRLCTSGENETQVHLERFSFTKPKREDLDLTIRKEKIVFWRRITRTLKDLYVNNKDIVYNETHITVTLNGNVGINTVRCESQPKQKGKVKL